MDKLNKNIFLLGGGEITKKETIKIDKLFLKEAGGVKNSKLLFFPTAAGDSEGYVDGFFKYFSDLGCRQIEFAKISSESKDKIKKKIDWANIIYLGGGSTDLLVNTFKTENLIEPLKNYLDKENILVGMSAGACALGELSVFSEIEEEIQVGKGWGILPDFIVVPHYDDKYQYLLEQIKKKYPQKKILGIPEKSAVHFTKSKVNFINRIVSK
jgi:dipeptidase E